MKSFLFTAAVASLLLSACGQAPEAPTAQFTEDGKLMRPDPTAWVYVSSSASAIAPTGAGGDAMMAGEGEMTAEGESEEVAAPEGRFDIIQIDPKAWNHYQQTGEFPEGTVFTMSFYSMHDKDMGADRYWTDQVTGMEVGVKDSGRFEDGWAYFRFEGDATEAEAFPKERCFECHAERGAKDNVFTQLYTKFQE